MIQLTRSTANLMQIEADCRRWGFGDRRAGEPTGYETLIHDCLIGDRTLFQRADAADAVLARDGRHWQPLE